MSTGRAISNPRELRDVITEDSHYTAGFAIGIIAIDLDYPKLPGNVVNATTYPYPVLYEKVSFPIEALFAGDPSIRDGIVDAAVRLEKEGVRAIIGACGFFAHFQKDVKKAVHVPVYLSSLCQLSMIETGLREDEKVAVLAASGESVTDRLLSQVGVDGRRIEVFDVGHLESFAPIRWGKTTLDNGRLRDDLGALAADIVREHPEIGAILLECSDLPPYARVIQQRSGLPVYDFITMINWVHQAVAQREYYGII